MILGQVALLILLLAASGFLSGTETAMFSLSRHELHQFRSSASRLQRMAGDLMREPRRVLLTLMVGNVTINILVFSLSLGVLQSIFGRSAILAPIVGLASPVMVVILGEVLPKATAMELRVRVAPAAAPIVKILQVILRPVHFLLGTLLVDPMTRLLVRPRETQEYVTVEELRELVEMSRRQGVIDAGETAMLQQVVRLSELRVRDVMVPRVDVTAFEVDDDRHELARLMRQERRKKVPVYEGEIDHVLGVVYAKEFFLRPDSPIRELIRPVRFVPDLINLSQLLEHFRRSSTQLAIVVDEFGGMVGLVTLEDAVEQIVGELPTPDELPGPAWQQLDERTYLVSGGASIRDWSGQLDIRRVDERVRTMGGLVLSRLGREPTVGDRVRWGNLLLTVDAMKGRRVERVRLELTEPDGQDGAADSAQPGGRR